VAKLLDLASAVLNPKPGVMPAPDGEFLVGTSFAVITDPARPNLFHLGEEERRIPLQIWYPAADKSEKLCPFIESREAARQFTKSMMLPPTLGCLADVATNSWLDAPRADGRFPVVFFSHGYGSFFGQNSQQHEHLASHGYIVVSVAHLHECFWPPAKKYDGAMKELKAASKRVRGKVNTPGNMNLVIDSAPLMMRSAEIWAEDVRVAADWFGESDWRNDTPLAHYGAFGHSFGGASSGELSLADPRCSCFVNMDGAFFCRLHGKETARPFLLVTGRNEVASGLTPNQKGYTHVTVRDAGHYDFSDLSLALPSFKLKGVMGDIQPMTMRNLLNDWLLAFFDDHLREIPFPEDLPDRYSAVSDVAVF